MSIPEMVGLLAPRLVRLGVRIGFSGTDLQLEDGPGFLTVREATELVKSGTFVGSVDESDVL